MKHITDREALEIIAAAIDGAPDHPWIPGAAMKPVMAALEAAGVKIPRQHNRRSTSARGPEGVQMSLPVEVPLGPSDPARFEVRHYGDITVSPITNNGDTSVVVRDNNFVEPLGYVGYVDMPEGKFFAFPEGSEQGLGPAVGYDSEKEAVEALRKHKGLVADLEYYLGHPPTNSDITELYDWLHNNPEGDLAEYVDAMKGLES